MLKKILKLTGFALLLVFLAATLSFSAKESKNVICRNIEIDFEKDEQIKTGSSEIVKLINNVENPVIGKSLRDIKAEDIEKEIEKHQAILKAEVYKIVAKDSSSYSGILGVRIKHREPVVRIMSSAGSYYLDESGEQIPVSTNYAANVLVASGYFSEEFAVEQVLPFVLSLNGDSFWKAQIGQIYIEQNGNVMLTTLVGNHIVELGTFENFSEKLRNTKAFYEQVMVNNKWDRYHTISVKYKNQVIAKKN